MSNLKSLILSLAIAGLLLPRASSAQEVVFLLHGLGSVPLSMWYLEDHLEEAGYTVRNLGYPSTHLPVGEAADLVRREVDRAEAASRVHFVAHSLGSIVVRKMLEHEIPNLGRMVMIAPPNGGSLTAQRLQDLDIFRWIFGPAGQQLAADNREFFQSLPIPPCEFGIIAGGKGDGEGFNLGLPGDDDGTVRVEETLLPGAADFLLLRDTHTLILFDPETSRQAVHFLKEGRFEKPKEEGGRGEGATRRQGD